MPIPQKKKKRKSSRPAGAPASISNAAEYLKTLRSDMARTLKRSDESLRRQLGSLYRVARVLSVDDDQWQVFCEQPDWEVFRRRPKPTKEGMAHALRHAIRYAVGFDGATSNRAVHRYTAALQQCWEQELPFDQVPKAIEDAGGIEKMKRNRAQQSSTMNFHLEGKAFAKKLGALADSPGALLFIAFRKDGDGSRVGEITTGLLLNEGRLTQQVMESLRTTATEISSRRPL